MHFISYVTIWPNTIIFLCLWHVKITWQKQACIKVYTRTLSSWTTNANNCLWLGWQLILDTNVTLFSYDDGPTLVISLKKTHLQYTIHKPTLNWACYNCVNAQRGNICKHQLKVLMFIHPSLVENIIVWFCGSLKGASQGVLKNLLSP
jgi:hypothetical protein